MRRQIAAAALALAVALLCAVPAGARAHHHKKPGPVPRGFIGMNVGGAALYSNVNFGQELDQMVSDGVTTIRVTFDWSSSQPNPPAANGQIATDWSGPDGMVEQAAERHLAILPVLLNAPDWDAAARPRGVAAPQQFGPFASWVKLAVERYGPGGTFWAQNPSVPYDPIHSWQVWNEPNLPNYWTLTPWVRTYVQMLKLTHAAIRSVDPTAKVVLAGLPDYVWTYMKEIYKIKGARKAFNVVAVHPYTKYAPGVITILQRVRAVMDKHGDRHKPIIATELGWPSSLHQSSQYYGFETTESGQASKLNALMPLIERDRKKLGLAGFDYYTWMDDEYPNAPSFNFAGLLAYRQGTIVTKPVYPVFRRWALKLSGCQAFGSVAGDCVRH